MFEGYFVLIVVAVAVLAGLSFAFSKSSTISSGEKRASLPNAQTVTRQQQKESSVQTVAPNKDAELIAKLYGELTRICLGDEAKVQRLIGFERKRNPKSGLAVLIQDAIDRWRDDND